MIHGVGTDVVAIARLERMLDAHGERAAAKLLASSEMERYRQAPKPAAFLAKRFAAKEALGKALGLGLRDPATLHNIAVASDGIGRPSFEFAPPLADWMRSRRLRAHLSLSDETDTALAFVVVETEGEA
ncbi:MAG: holo-ACP synthase [Betaproteobacteria bacterium]|nr:holo-ACP synthase [Betaproteobacteria bacterium]